MGYEINISLNGSHYFATNKRSIESMKDAVAMVADLKKRFPKDEGFEISLTRWDCYGTEIPLA